MFCAKKVMKMKAFMRKRETIITGRYPQMEVAHPLMKAPMMVPHTEALLNPACHGPVTRYPSFSPKYSPYFFWNAGYAQKFPIRIVSYLESLVSMAG